MEFAHVMKAIMKFKINAYLVVIIVKRALKVVKSARLVRRTIGLI